MDQAASADQTVLRHLRQRREDANLDRGFRLCRGRHRQEALGLGSLPLHFAADSLRHSLRQNADATGTF